MAEEISDTSVTTQELDRSFSVPTLMANRFMLNAMGGGIRIAFAENPGPDFPDYFRYAVLISREDAESLRDVLTDILTKSAQPPRSERGDHNGR